MKRSTLVFVVLVILLVFVLILSYSNESQQAQEKNRIKTLVIDAANEIEVNGQGVFSDFRQEGSRWFYGNTYVFIWKTDGVRVVYPPDLNGEGQNMTSLIDANRKPIGLLFIDIAESQSGEGWIEYSWPKPGQIVPSIKESFIKSATFGNQSYLVGSGAYFDNFESTFMVPLQYIAIVLEATIAAGGLFLGVKKKRVFGYGIFLTFAIYVFYDLARLNSIELSNSTFYSVFFVATLSMLWVVILLNKDARTA